MSISIRNAWEQAKIVPDEKIIHADSLPAGFDIVDGKLTYEECESCRVKFSPWEICGECRGEGKHCHHIDGNGLPDSFREDDDSMEDYFSGAYDRECESCDGSGKLKMMMLDANDPNYAVIVVHLQEAELSAYESDAISRAERRMGA
jgi:hypothetical protein